MECDPGRIVFGRHVFDGGYDATHQIINSQVKFTAILSSNDEMALGAYNAIKSAGKQTRSAMRAYELISRKYSEGQSSLLELIDARTSLTGAAANSIVARSEYYSRLADFECAMGANGPENY